jgi:UDP-glucose 4-epimerase
MLEWFLRIHGFRYASLRYFNAAGATRELGENHSPESHLIYDFVADRDREKEERFNLRNRLSDTQWDVHS